MRRALGLNASGGNMTAQQRPDQARQRHRFVQDGGVPVVVLNHRTDETTALRERIEALEASLDTERGAHAATRRTVSEQQAQVQSLETRLAHAELAHRDAMTQAQRTQATLQEHIAQLQAQRPGREAKAAGPVPETPRPDIAAPEHDTADTVPTATDAAPAKAAEPAGAPRKRGRPRLHPPKEPKPVRWWTPSFKAKTKA